MKRNLLVLVIFANQLCYAQFTGNYAPGNFVHSSTNSNGSSAFTGNTSLAINGTDNDPEGLDQLPGEEVETVNVVSSGILHFTVNITQVDEEDPEGRYDEFGYKINGVSTALFYDVGIYDTTITVTAGQTFAFYVSSQDNTGGPLNAIISNFSYSTVLPLRLVSFTGTNDKVNSNTLSWTTANEIHTRSFEIERSTDGASFVKVGSVKATLNSAGVKKYSYDDIYDFLQGSTYYYRLKMLDQDMAYTYSPVVLLQGKGRSVIKISPNPFTDKITLSVASTSTEIVKLQLLDVNGSKVFEQAKAIATGNNVIEINLPKSISKGVYLLHINTSAEDKTIKVIKQ